MSSTIDENSRVAFLDSTQILTLNAGIDATVHIWTDRQKTRHLYHNARTGVTKIPPSASIVALTIQFLYKKLVMPGPKVGTKQMK